MEKNTVVEKLKNEHQEILNVLKSAYKKNGLADNDWKNALIGAKKLFEGHLNYEDETIYEPGFFEKADFGAYRETAKKFHEEMQDITIAVENFFKKYSASTDFPDFKKDYASLVNTIEKRIRAEEAILFEKYLQT